MARAKRTDRAEARRRYRATLATEQPDELEPDDAASEAATPGRTKATASRRSPDKGTSPARSGTSAPFQRVGFLDAFRLAARPANVREDVAALPQLIRSKAIWPISLAVIAIGVIYTLFPGYSLVAIATSTLLQPPALIPPFVAGLLAPRAAWLAGALVGVVAALVTSLIFVAAPGASAGASAVGSVAFFLIVSPLFGAGVGAFAGFYRRFLRLSSPASAGGQARSRRTNTRGRTR